MTPAEYPITLNGVSGSLQRSAAFRAHLANAPPSASPLLVPADNAVNVATGVVLQWGQATQAFDYRVELASDPAFAQILASTRTRALSWAPGLAPGSSYWWRVIAGNACSDAAHSFANGFEDGAVGAGTVSATGSFSTAPAATAAAPR
jgi:phosphodiesterase/alkaline phosphatase D-like protein